MIILLLVIHNSELIVLLVRVVFNRVLRVIRQLFWFCNWQVIGFGCAIIT